MDMMKSFISRLTTIFMLLLVTFNARANCTSNLFQIYSHREPEINTNSIIYRGNVLIVGNRFTFSSDTAFLIKDSDNNIAWIQLENNALFTHVIAPDSAESASLNYGFATEIKVDLQSCSIFLFQNSILYSNGILNSSIYKGPYDMISGHTSGFGGLRFD